MFRITATNQKGGVGKTALSVDLARFAAKRKSNRVLFIDFDVQHNASDSLVDCEVLCDSSSLLTSDISNIDLPDIAENSLYLARATNALANISSLNTVELIRQGETNLEHLSKFFDLVIMDTPPTLGVTLTVALSLSHKVFVPIEPETSSITGAINVAVTLNNLKKKLNVPEMNMLGIVINKMKNKPRQKQNIETIKNHSVLGKMLIPNFVCDRDSIAESLTEHMDIRSIKKTAARKAVKELNELNSYLLAQTSDTL